MLKKEFTHNRLRVSYLEWGIGANAILCFHGFGRQSQDFQLFVDLLRPDQRLISLDLHAHSSSGFTQNYENKPSIQPQELSEFLKAFFKKKNIETCDLIGYSMGGRIALCMWQMMPNHVSSVLLLATDGLKKNLVYRFTTGTIVGRKVYRYFILKPNLLFAIANFLHWTKILHPKLHRFLYVNMGQQASRQLVYDTWIGYKHCFPDLKKLGKEHEKNAIPLSLVFGKNDSIIRPQMAKNMTKHFSKPIRILIMDSGHRLLNDDLIALIKSQHLWPKYRAIKRAQ